LNIQPLKLHYCPAFYTNLDIEVCPTLFTYSILEGRLWQISKALILKLFYGVFVY